MAAQPAGGGGDAAPDTVVATVGDTQFTLEQIDDTAMRQQASTFAGLTLQQALYESRRTTIDRIVIRTLLEAEAAAQGIDVETLARQQIGAKVAPPTDADISAWYTANPQRVQGATLEQVRDAIAELLLEERTVAAEQAYVATLRAKTPVTVTLEPPREDVADAGRPARGPDNAPVEIIEFSDFQCPYCLQAKATVDAVLATYGDRIRFVYRHYPLPNHPDARPAAEASMCAAEQGQFWPFHDHLFANSNDLSAEGLKRHAATLGLNVAVFNACFDSRKYSDVVDEDMAAANEIGVTGTPAFFINGRPLGGAQPFEAFERIIEDELARN
jgi:protein-disulfide isomerase